MKNFASKLVLIVSLVYSNLAYAESINGFVNSPVVFGANNVDLVIESDGDVEVDTDNSGVAAISNTQYTNSTITVKASFAANGVEAVGENYGAIEFSGGASLSLLDIQSGTVTSEVASSEKGTVLLSGISETSSHIIVGKDSGGSGTLSNSGVGGNAFIIVDSSDVDLTIDNKATGIISSQGDAISLNDLTETSVFTLNNSGEIISGEGYEALSLYGYSTTVTNYGQINGKILADNNALALTQSGGEINGDIILGNNEASFVSLNGGTVTGNISMNNSSQIVILSGGGLSGDINGSGSVRVDASKTLGGSIGNDLFVDLVSISNGNSLTSVDGSYTISSGEVKIGTGSSLNINFSQLYTNEVDGLADDSGILNIGISDNSEVEISALFGTSNGLSAVNISGNLTDGSKSSSVNLAQNINALTSTFKGVGSAFNLQSDKTITGNVVIGDGARLQLDDNSSVSGTIAGEAQYNGSLVFLNTHLDPSAVSSITLNGDVGGDGKDLFSIVAAYNTYIDASSVQINAQNIYLSSLARLNLGGDSVNGEIKGFTFLALPMVLVMWCLLKIILLVGMLELAMAIL